MKAASYYAPKDIRIIETSIPSCPDGGVLIKVIGNTICGTDIEIYKNGYYKISPPQILGHECCGEIIEIKNENINLEIGDRVTIQPSIHCGLCEFCQRGIFNLCENLESMPWNYSGTFAEYVAVPQKAVENGNLLKVPANLSDKEACLAEPLACVLNAQELLQIKAGETVLVIGAGPAGLLNAEMARINGAESVIIAEKMQKRIDKAKEFNYSEYINTTKEDLVDAIMRITDKRGVDVVICAAPAKVVQEKAVEALAPRGRLSLFSALSLKEPDIKISNRIIHYKEISIIGAAFSTIYQMKLSLDILAKGLIKSNKIITHTLLMEKINEAINLCLQGEGLKVYLKNE